MYVGDTTMLLPYSIDHLCTVKLKQQSHESKTRIHFQFN